MSVTDELRRLMDERGVKHKDEDTPLDTHGTLYRVTTTADWVYEEPPECDLLVRSRYDIGAEDAIEVEATLGRGTCKMDTFADVKFQDIDEDEEGCYEIGALAECSGCGSIVLMPSEYAHFDRESLFAATNYCPNCGRKAEQ